MSSNPEPSRQQEPDTAAGRVIVVSWPVVVVPLALVVVVAAGFLFGRLMYQRQAAAVAPAAPIAPVVQANTGAYQVPADPAGAAGGGAVPQDPITAFDPDTVYDLPRRPHPLLGQPAPDFTMKLLGTGESVALSDYLGKPVVLDFWATWCPPCRQEMPWFQDLHDRHAEDGLQVLAFNVGEKVPASLVEQTISQFVTGLGLTIPVLYGEENLAVQRAYNVMGYPSAFLIDSDGNVVDFHQGMFPNLATLESRVNAILPEGAAAAGPAATP